MDSSFQGTSNPFGCEALQDLQLLRLCSELSCLLSTWSSNMPRTMQQTVSASLHAFPPPWDQMVAQLSSLAFELLAPFHASVGVWLLWVLFVEICTQPVIKLGLGPTCIDPKIIATILQVTNSAAS